jgi:hypothetical protein
MHSDETCKLMTDEHIRWQGKDRHSSQIVVLCLQSGGFRTQTFGGGCWKWKPKPKPCGENRTIPPESLKPFSCPGDSVRYFSASPSSKSSFSFVPPELAKTLSPLHLQALGLDWCQPPPLYCNRKRFCSHQPLGFPSRWPRLLTMLCTDCFAATVQEHETSIIFGGAW